MSDSTSIEIAPQDELTNIEHHIAHYDEVKDIVLNPRDDDTNISTGHDHFSHRSQFLRALVMGLNDGVVSTAALLIGFATGAQNVSNSLYILTGLSGIVAGSLSMCIGEYVSVSSQLDSEQADIQKEIAEQQKGPEARAKELVQLTQIFKNKGLEMSLLLIVWKSMELTSMLPKVVEQVYPTHIKQQQLLLLPFLLVDLFLSYHQHGL
jgi:hypothetical protein